MIERRPLLIAACATVAGIAAGVLVSALAPRRAVAEETLVASTRSGALPRPETAARTIGAVAEGSAVEANVASALGLSAGEVRRSVSVSFVPETDALRVRASAPTSTRAIQLGQQYALVLAEDVSARLAPLRVTVADPAHAAGRTSAHWARNIVALGSLGLLLAALATTLLGRRPQDEPALEEVSDSGPEEPEEEAAPEPEPVPEPEPEPQPEPEVVAAAGIRSTAELRRRVDAARAEHPDRAAEWDAYLAQLEPHAVGGVLPERFLVVIEDVFGEIL